MQKEHWDIDWEQGESSEWLFEFGSHVKHPSSYSLGNLYKYFSKV